MLSPNYVMAVSASTCEATPKRHAVQINGAVAGERRFAQTVGGRWLYTLEPSAYGWDMRLRDKDGVDLSQITPPFRLAPNPREIYGWHFRNAANTAKNSGDVNAPQHVRLFQFSASLSGTGGFRPPSGTASPQQIDPDNGRGALTILDMGLADLEPEQKARMNYLKFHVCLTWLKTEQEITEQDNAQSPLFLDEERERIFGCGLDPNQYELSAWILPRWRSGDLDGDDAIDEIAPVVRRSDQRKGIVICRAGAWLSIIGYGQPAQIPLQTKEGEPALETYFTLAQYLGRSEYWKVKRAKNGGDHLVLGRWEKSEVVIYWDGKQFIHELLWVIVEP
ncbi:MAG: hypothetical protein KUG72_13285 [Pseudomonadales bacterium]|nr:hypothetical protein [Pseudomonadales bacterium]